MATPPSITGILKIDTERTNEYMKKKYYLPKLSFLQKVGRFMGKALSFIGPIGAAVMSVALPGIGLPLAAATYGLSNMAGKLTAKAEYGDQIQAAVLSDQQSKLPVILPGLFEQASQVDIMTNFITPSSLTGPATNTIINRLETENSKTQNFNFY